MNPRRETARKLLRPACWFVALLALLHALVGVSSVTRKSATSDEPAHLMGGYAFNTLGDFRMQPENGNLPQRLHALPAVLLGANPPPLDHVAWREADVWQFAHIFLRRSGNDGDRLLLLARALNSLFAAGVVVLVGWWAWRLGGPAAGIWAAAFAAACTTLLAHGPLATSDMAMTLFWLACPAAWWWHLRARSAKSLALSSACFALACVAKFTAVLLPPALVLLAAAHLWHRRRAKAADSPATPPPAIALPGSLPFSVLVHGLAAWLVIWAFFGFRYAAHNPALPPGTFALPWEVVGADLGFPGSIISLCRATQALPEGYLYGLAFVLKHAEARAAFLDGAYSIHGWASFFPKALLYKTSPALLAAAFLGASLLTVSLLRRRPAAAADRLTGAHWLWPLLLPLALYWAVSITSNLNIGHRHILPTYPALHILAGLGAVLAARLVPSARRPWATAAVALLLALHALAAARVHPHHLAYFSPIAGGPENGHRHLVDSSLDWGQDLPGLRDWLDQNRRPGETVHLSYFGTDDPKHYGIEAQSLPTILDLRERRPWTWPGPGLYAVSATMLQHVYQPLRGPWTPENEAEYQACRALDPFFRSLKKNPADPEPLALLPPEGWETRWRRFETLRFARLCHYLRLRGHDAQVGYSILLYRLDARELEAALEKPFSTLIDAAEQAALARRNNPTKD